MGAGQSRDELLYQEVQNGNYDAVKALRRNGASLEWIDKEGRTPLILACTRGELLDMALTLLNLGANINAYRPGVHGGFPLHHAAKRGLEKTVTLLLSRGADPLAINDDGQTPLEMARSRSHVSVVRLLEEHLCLFSGMLRELSGLGILETLAPNLVTKKIWAVVLPTESHPKRAPKYELAVYQSPKMPQPRTIISLAKVEIEEPKFNIPDPVLYITDKTIKTKYKFLSENEGDKAQLERLYKACRGIPQMQITTVPINNHGLPAAGYQLENLPQTHPVSLQQGVPSSANQPVLHSATMANPVNLNLNNSGAEPMPGKIALAQITAEQGLPVPPDVPNPSRLNDYKGWDAPDGSYKGWGPPDSVNQPKKAKETSYGGWEGEQNSYNGWGPAEAGPSRPENVSSDQRDTAALPSAPPLPDGPICYPSVDGTEPGMDPPLISPNERIPNANSSADDEAGGMCVVCWDAPAEGACVPCGHLAGCMNCLAGIRAKKWGCPVCREQIQQVIKVYAV